MKRTLHVFLERAALCAMFFASLCVFFALPLGADKENDNTPVYIEEYPYSDGGAAVQTAEVYDAPPLFSAADIIGINDIIFQPETDADNALRSIQSEPPTAEVLEKLLDFEYLRSEFYIVDADTGLLPSDVDTADFINAGPKINLSAKGPKILIFHTHSNEMYADSAPGDPYGGVMGVGRALADMLNNEYGIETLHHAGRYDIVDGRSQVLGAYERMEPDVERVLRENPSIQLAIDIHRDGLRDGIPPMLADIGGENAAKIMFVNGLCRLRSNGVLAPVAGLENPYIKDNLRLSFRMQLAANQLYPGFARKLYLKAYRYSLNMLPNSLLIEVGAQNNTVGEALNAVPPLAEIIADAINNNANIRGNADEFYP